MDQQQQQSGQQQSRAQPLYDITQGGHYGASAALLWKQNEDNDRQFVEEWKRWTKETHEFFVKKQSIIQWNQDIIQSRATTEQPEDQAEQADDIKPGLETTVDNDQKAATVPRPNIDIHHSLALYLGKTYADDESGEQLSAQGYIPHTELYSGLWSNINQGLTGTSRDILATYWQQTINHLETDSHDFKIHQLPLARIKKVMKADPEVKMISAEAPILFAKGCDIFITELTMRAWIHAEDNKRRTLQRSDIAAALAKSDMFDFLIDIVPREESSGASKRPNTSGGQQGGQQPAQAQQPAQQPQMGAPDYGQLQHGGMAPPEQQYGRGPGMYAAPHMGGDGQQDPSQYGQPAQMFAGQDMYNPYTQGGFAGGQQMYMAGQRPPSQGYAGRPGTAGNE